MVFPHFCLFHRPWDVPEGRKKMIRKGNTWFDLSGPYLIVCVPSSNDFSE